MICELASPSVCVIDDELDDYAPILQALNRLHVGAVHFLGNAEDQLPAAPFCGIRLVLTDLHLSGLTGKDAASHAANVFLRIVSKETAPVVVVIWSKYANDVLADGVPNDDQESEADLFKRTLIEAEPAFKERLIFLEMAKPMKTDRPEEAKWVEKLQKEIETTIAGKKAIQLLWAWERLVRNSCVGITEQLTSIAHGPGNTIDEGLSAVMQMLASAQAEGDLSDATAPRHLVSILSNLLSDQIEHSDGTKALGQHGTWLTKAAIGTHTATQLNAIVLTSMTTGEGARQLPGTIYDGMAAQEFESIFGEKIGKLSFECFSKRRHDSNIDGKERNRIDKADCDAWRAAVKPVLVEISPACDVAQKTRISSLLVAGLIIPHRLRQNVKSGEAFLSLPTFSLRWEGKDFAKQDAVLVFCSRYKVSFAMSALPGWLKPWFRLRELPTAAIRNWHASHSARVGFPSISA